VPSAKCDVGETKLPPRSERPSQPDALVVSNALIAPNAERGNLLELLLDIRDARGFVDDDALEFVATRLNMTNAELYELATFYPALNYRRRGTEPHIEICDDLVCRLRRDARLDAALGSGLLDGRPCRAGGCHGRCDRAPVITRTRDAVAPAKIERDFESFRKSGGYEIVERLRARAIAAECILDSVESSGAYGRAGAHFPVARKWRAAIAQARSPVVIVNADEGELGAFKDRFILESDPHGVLEAALVAAIVVGAAHVVVYLRDDYKHLHPALKNAVAALTESGIPGGIRIDVRRSGGAYICGEETALIASLEGRRALPHDRPPFPTSSGLFGAPTLVHNVETVYRLRSIWGAERDPSVAATEALDPNALMFSVSGHVREPGLKVVSSLRNLFQLVACARGMTEGREFGGIVIGGSAGTIVSAEDCMRPLAELTSNGLRLGTGSAIVFSREDAIRDIAAALAAFLARESCGQCAPCRVGTAKMARMLAEGQAHFEDGKSLALAMREASICNLGRNAGVFLERVIDQLRGGCS
jgi:NADH:ubiquinone oxidoreductase subunit F (NADH-binding)